MTLIARSRSAATFAVCVIAILFSASAHSQVSMKDLARARVIAEATCASCHYKDGNSIFSTTPKIAGQHSAYIYKQLHDFKGQNGKPPARYAASMLLPLGILNDSDFHALAIYYSEKTLIPEKAKSPKTFELGQRIWLGGNYDRNIPACAGCHGPSGQGIPPLYPRLQGQFADYTRNVLMAYKTGALTNDSSGTMQAVSKRMTQNEIEAISDYIAGLR
ncbi:c-type cytochrome [Uliginosibacterium gangwonense]|uniref:c-type cytochrome n=1 Tax=Uliginosibacterium gangwonense TaxID=392736 RepID=UPI0012F7B5AD|nr:c-type cytochrome [Uliginosibacterium gangwonense]